MHYNNLHDSVLRRINSGIARNAYRPRGVSCCTVGAAVLPLDF